jgi:hypothetical protein
VEGFDQASKFWDQKLRHKHVQEHGFANSVAPWKARQKQACARFGLVISKQHVGSACTDLPLRCRSAVKPLARVPAARHQDGRAFFSAASQQITRELNPPLHFSVELESLIVG